MARSGRHWFLPDTPDLLGMLSSQLDVTMEGMDAFAAWAGGDARAATMVHDLEHRADQVKRDLQRTLRGAFITPLEPEDLFALSQDIDRVLNQAKDLIGESEVMACPPDGVVAEMATQMCAAMRELASSRRTPALGTRRGRRSRGTGGQAHAQGREDLPSRHGVTARDSTICVR